MSLIENDARQTLPSVRAEEYDFGKKKICAVSEVNLLIE